MLKNYIISILTFIIIVFAIFSSIKYNKIEREYLDLKMQQETENNFLQRQNDSLLLEINQLYETIQISNHKIDSLKTLKRQIIIEKEFVVSENINESVFLLKENLRCEQ